MREKIYTLMEVSKILKSSINYVQELRKSGILKCIKIGHYKVTESSLNEFLLTYNGKDVTDPYNVKELVI